MAGEIAQAFVRIRPDTKGFKAETEKGVSSGLLGIVGPAKIAGAAISAMGGAVAIAGFKFDSMKQQATIAFTTMLGDGQKAKVFLDDLQSFAAKTPFEFPELVKSSQMLMAMGFEAKDVIPTMTAIGDAVAGLGGNAETLNSVTRALGQIQAKGKASAQEMMQLTESGIPSWRYLADAIGTSIPEAMDKVSKGMISSGVVIDAVTTGMGESFGGMMDKQSHSWAGLISTLKDTFSQLSGTVMQPFFEMATNGLQRVVDALSSKGFLSFMQNDLPNAMSIAGEAVRMFVSAIVAVFGFIKPGLDLMYQALADVVGGITTVVRTFQDSNFEGFFAKLSASITSLNGPLAYTIGIAAGLAAALGVLVVATKIATVVQAAWNMMLLANPIGFIVLAIGALVGALVVLYVKNQWVHDKVNEAWVGIKKIVGGVIDYLRDLWAKYGAYLTSVGNSSFGALKAIIVATWQRIKDVIHSAMLIIKGVINVVMGLIQGDWSKVWTGIKQVFDGIWTDMISRVRFFYTVFKQVAGVLGTILDPAWKWMKKQAIQAALDIVEPFSHIPRKFGGGWAQDLKKNLQASLDGLNGPAASSGTAVANSFGVPLLAGITNYVNAAKDQVNSLRVAAEASAARIASMATSTSNMLSPGTPTPTPTPTPTTTPTPIPTGVGGPAGGGPAGEPQFGLTKAMQIVQARAELTKSNADDLKVYRDQLAWVKSQMNKLTGDQLLSALQLQKSIMDNISQIASAKTAHLKDLADAQRKVVAAQEKELKDAYKKIDKMFADVLKEENKAKKDMQAGIAKSSADSFNSLVKAGQVALEQQSSVIKVVLAKINRDIANNRSAFTSSWQTMASAGLKAFDRMTSDTLEKMKKDVSAQLALFDKETSDQIDKINGRYTQLTASEKALQDLTTSHDAAAKAAEYAANQQALAAAKISGSVSAIASAQAAVANDAYQQRVDALTVQAALERDAANKQQAAEVKDATDQRATLRETLAQQLADKVQAYEDERSAQHTAFEIMQKELEAKLGERGSSIDKANALVVEAFKKFGVAISSEPMKLPDGSTIANPFSEAVVAAAANAAKILASRDEAVAAQKELDRVASDIRQAKTNPALAAQSGALEKVARALTPIAPSFVETGDKLSEEWRKLTPFNKAMLEESKKQTGLLVGINSNLNSSTDVNGIAFGAFR